MQRFFEGQKRCVLGNGRTGPRSENKQNGSDGQTWFHLDTPL